MGRVLHKGHGRRQSGFTIIELLIATTITAILAAVAIPVYSGYQARARVAEAMSIGSVAKQAVAEYSVFNGAFPEDNEAAGLREPDEYSTRYVEAMTIYENGVVVVDLQGGAFEGQMLVLEPTRNGGSVDWVCWSSLADKFLPPECRGGGLLDSGDEPGGDDEDDSDTDDDGGDGNDDSDDSDSSSPRQVAQDASKQAKQHRRDAKQAANQAAKAARQGNMNQAQQAAQTARDAADQAEQAAQAAREAANKAAELAESGDRQAVRDARKADNAAKQAENAAARARVFADRATQQAGG
ncbi:MAG: pilin [Nevskiales bacterium]